MGPSPFSISPSFKFIQLSLPGSPTSCNHVCNCFKASTLLRIYRQRVYLSLSTTLTNGRFGLLYFWRSLWFCRLKCHQLLFSLLADLNLKKKKVKIFWLRAERAWSPWVLRWLMWTGVKGRMRLPRDLEQTMDEAWEEGNGGLCKCRDPRQRLEFHLHSQSGATPASGRGWSDPELWCGLHFLSQCPLGQSGCNRNYLIG